MTRTALLFASSAAALLAACAADGDARETAADRGPIGKADLVGSCGDTDCDGAAPGNCWCDELCVEYGDCCADRVEICEGPVSPICGGFVGFTCGDDSMYCDFEQEDNCGAVDQTGTCRPLPGACTEEFAPVCGCNGQTYSNSCFAAMGGTSVVHDGACAEPAGGSCGGHLGLACGDGQYCEYHADDLCGASDHLGTCQELPQACTEELAPVCGCDGETHSNACFAAMAGTSVAYTGACQ